MRRLFYFLTSIFFWGGGDWKLDNHFVNISRWICFSKFEYSKFDMQNPMKNKYKVETIGKIFSRQWKSIL